MGESVQKVGHLSQGYVDYLSSPEWRTRRNEALAAAGRRCKVCNTPKRLDVHHRTYGRFRHEAPGDLTVLCRACHDLFHHRMAAPPKSAKQQQQAKKTPK